MKVRGHGTITITQAYVNLVSQDVHDVTDRTEARSPVPQLPLPASRAGTDMLNCKRSTGRTYAIHERAELAAKSIGMDGADEGNYQGTKRLSPVSCPVRGLTGLRITVQTVCV